MDSCAESKNSVFKMFATVTREVAKSLHPCFAKPANTQITPIVSNLILLAVRDRN